tara:strand:- start:571 stop:816 length:246 start_codon:yes stop_codon:yes gene_type:complete
MSNKTNAIARNTQEIEKLKAEHMSRFSVITTKKGKEFDDEIRECNNIIGKINTLEKKNKLMSEGYGPNGISDGMDGYNIIE